MTTTTKAARFTKGKARFYECEGMMLPSVTTILGMLAKPALVNWAGKVNREAACREAATFYAIADDDMSPERFHEILWKNLEKRVFHNELAREAADLGTLAHSRCEWLIQKAMGQPVGPDPIEKPGTGTDAERALWASLSFEDWLEKHDVKPLATEVTVYSMAHGFAGTADLIATVDGIPAVIDLKTSSGIWPEMSMQVAAYRVAANEPQKMHVQDAYILRLPKKVTDPDFEAVRVERLDDHFKAFLALKDVFAWHEAVTK